MTLEEAERIYKENLYSAEKFITDISSNKDGVLINSAITNSYLELAHNDPACAWFSLGTLVSSVVGQNIHFSSVANAHTASQVDSAMIVVDAFSKGNQNIFKSIVPLYKTYQQIGPEGAALLANVKEGEFKTPFSEDHIIKAFDAYEKLQSNLQQISESLNLPTNHPEVINQLYTDPENLLSAKNMATNLAIHEQKVVEPMYNDGKLSQIITDPLLGLVGQQFKLNGIEINNKNYVMLDYIKDPSSFDQRMDFAKILIEALMNDFFSNGMINVFHEIQGKADYNLWLGNPYTSPDKIGGISGWYWGKKADSFEKKLLSDIKEFVNFKPEITDFNVSNQKPSILWDSFINKTADKVIEYFSPHKDTLSYKDSMPSDFASLANLIKEAETSSMSDADLSLNDHSKTQSIDSNNFSQSDSYQSDVSDTGVPKSGLLHKVFTILTNQNSDKLDIVSDNDTLDLSSIKTTILDASMDYGECKAPDSLFPPLEELPFETTISLSALTETPKTDESFITKWTTKVFDNIFPSQDKSDVTLEDIFPPKEKNVVSLDMPSTETSTIESLWNKITNQTPNISYSPIEDNALKDLFLSSPLHKETKSPDVYGNALDFLPETKPLAFNDVLGMDHSNPLNFNTLSPLNTQDPFKFDAYNNIDSLGKGSTFNHDPFSFKDPLSYNNGMNFDNNPFSKNTFNNDILGTNNFGGSTYNNFGGNTYGNNFGGNTYSNNFDPFPKSILGGGFTPPTYNPLSFNKPYSIGGGGGGLFGGFKSSKSPSTKALGTTSTLSATESITDQKSAISSDTDSKIAEVDTSLVHNQHDYMNDPYLQNPHHIFE